MRIKIAVDCMGGDHGPKVTVPASLDYLENNSQSEIILVGLHEEIAPYINKYQNDRLTILHATQVIAMDEPPAVALRTKKDSSLRVAINLVKSGEADTCISAGNTGALMAISRFVLKMLPGIERPAICTVLPTLKGETLVL